MKFENYNITAEIKRNLAELGFRRPTDIQFKAIPSIIKGEDVLAIAQTGTGKTAAFAIPLVDQIHRAKKNRRTKGIKCLILVPTRELAAQIGDVFHFLSKHTRVKTFALHGGVEQDPQIRKLEEGIDVLIATPGRMFDLISQGYIHLDDVVTLVLDEADHMLDLGFIDDIKAVKKRLTKRHQTLFFSATINRDIKKLAFSQVKNTAIRIQISPEDPVSKNVSHFVMFVEMDAKRFFLERFIHDNPEKKIIVFVRTRVRADRVVKAMGRVSIPALAIHGDKDQSDRTEVMKLFKSGQSRLLVATDVTARGLDIPDVDYVINYDLPEKTENYVHRVGRTGRGVRLGVALSFCSSEEKPRLEEIQEFLHKPVEVLKITKKEYALTIDPSETAIGLDALISPDEIRPKKKSKGKKTRDKKLAKKKSKRKK
jgi:ATP-dependent RNA helicase RhlE